MFLLGFGCSPENESKTSALSASTDTSGSEAQVPSTNNLYKQLYFEYQTKVLKSLGNDLDLNDMTDEFVRNAEFHIPIIYLSKQTEDGNWDLLVERTDPQLQIFLPEIHYGKSEDVHLSTIQEGMCFLETGMTTNLSTRFIYKNGCES